MKRARAGATLWFGFKDVPLRLLFVFQGGDILRVSNGFLRNYERNGYRDVKVNVIAAEHICEIQLHLRPFHSLTEGQHKVYEWSRALSVTTEMAPHHLFKNMEPGTLELMTRLSRENWCSTSCVLPFLLLESGEYEEARALLRKVSIIFEWRVLLRFAFSKHCVACRPITIVIEGNYFVVRPEKPVATRYAWR